MSDYRKDVAKITDAFLGLEAHGIFTLQLFVDYGNSGCQGVGGYGLDVPVKKLDGSHSHRAGSAYGHEFIIRTMRACGVDEWSKIVGRTIYVLQDLPEGSSALGTSKVVGIENLPTEPGERFVFADLAEQMGYDQ